MASRSITAFLWTCTLLLAGCGGGGAGGSDGPAPAPAAGAPTPSPQPAPTPATPSASNQPPTASVWVSTTTGQAPAEMVFDASASSDSDGEVSGFSWDFGDGTLAEGIRLSHVYAQPGVYEVRLRVVDDDDAVAEAVQTVTVEASVAPGFRVAGRIRIQASTAVDSDTNDPSLAPVSNDDFDSAQTVPAPGTVGGYVAAPNNGVGSGALHVDGDRSDVYQFSAAGGEVVSLTIARAGQDLDLRLYDATRTQIDEAMGVGSREVLDAISEPGEYFVQVSTFGDAASNYVLTIGSQPGLNATTLRGGADFVAGELLIGPAVHGAQSTPARPLPAMSFERQAGRRDDAGEGRTRLARLDGDIGAFRSASLDVPGAAPLTAAQRAHRRTLEAIKALHASRRYAWVEPNWIRRPSAVPDDPWYPNQWHFETIHLPQAWDVTQGSEDVVVAVVDSGILATHPAFTDPDGIAAPRLVDGYDFISDPDRAADGDGRDGDPTDPGVSGVGGTSRFHGTHVAGTIGARTDDGRGVAGAGWNTRIMPLRVLGAGGGTSADLIEALRYAAGLDNASGALPSRRADIINLSLGASAASEAERAVIEEIRALGVIVVAAAGNDASDAPAFPAGYDGVVSVAATTIEDRIAFYSNFGATIDVAAPGGENSTDVNGDGIGDGVLSAIGEDDDLDPATPPTPNVGSLAGTSMAAPHVAAVAALMKAVHPDMGPEEFDALLAAGLLTVDLGDAGRDDRFGHGRIDAQRAVLAALRAAGGDAADIAVLVTAPSTLNFGPFTDALDFRVSNAGTAALAAEVPFTDVPWLTLEAIDVDPATGLGTWRARLDRSRLPGDGAFGTSIEVESDANRASIAVRAQRASIDLSADAGHSYIVLTAEDDSRALYRTTATARLGEYDFSIDGVAPGRYRLFAGTDADHDDLICDGGEACGAWRTMDAPSVLVVEGDIDDIEFITAFRGNLSPNGALPFGAVECSGCAPR